MNLHRSLFVASMALASLQTGCMADADVKALDQLGLDTLDTPTKDPDNGIHPAAAMASATDLLEAMDKGIYDPTNDAVDRLLNSVDGWITLYYAADCALPETASPVDPEGRIVGGSVLNTTAGWMTGGLSLSQKEDVWTCLVSRFNSLGGHVTLRLTGDHVNSSADPVNHYGVAEALWIAEIDPVLNRVLFRAWPLNDLVMYCEENMSEQVATRICGTQDGAACSIDVRMYVGTINALQADCEDSNQDGNYTCLGRPAIKSWLNSNDVVAAYRDCGSP